MNAGRKIFPLLFVLLGAFAASAVESEEEDPYYLLTEQASKAIAEKRYDDAAARLIDAMSIRPGAYENVLLLSNLGMVYSYQGRDSLALETLDEALRRAPSMRTVRLNRAGVLLGMGRSDEAADDLEKVLDVDSVNVRARYLHGMIALRKGDLQRAETDFAVLASVEPDGDNTAVAMSTLYILRGQSREAIPYLKKLTGRVPDADTYASLAGCYIDIDELADAGATIAEGLSKFPDNGELYLCRAELNIARYRLDEAHADARKAVMLGVSRDVAEALFNKK